MTVRIICRVEEIRQTFSLHGQTTVRPYPLGSKTGNRKPWSWMCQKCLEQWVLNRSLLRERRCSGLGGLFWHLMWEGEDWGWDATGNRVFSAPGTHGQGPPQSGESRNSFRRRLKLNLLIQQVQVCLTSQFPGPFPTHSFSSCQQLCEIDVITFFLGMWKLKLREAPTPGW